MYVDDHMKKYYEILELDESATIEEVEKAYKELAEAWRPESYKNLPRFKRKAEIKLKEVNDAYERVRSYLLVKQSGEAQKLFLEPAKPSPGSEPETHPVAAMHPPQNSTPARRKTRTLGLIAMVAVLSALLLYVVLERQKPQRLELQANTTGKETPAIDSAPVSAPASAEKLNKGAESNFTGGPGAEKQSAPGGGSAQKTSLQERSGDEIRLTQEALSRYNRYPMRVKRIQNGLITIGYNPGPIDGVIGPQTTGALKQFADDHDHVIETGGLLASDFTDAVLVFAEVAAAHPDWDRIVGNEDFARWLDSQTEIPAYRVNQIKKTAPARQVIEMINLYKSRKEKP